jgi:hypothetical protein
MAGIATLLQPKRVQGPGNGMSDSVPAQMPNGQPAALSDGEYVLPAQVVSALGNGSTEAGARLLDEFCKRVYQSQTGKSQQMQPLSLQQLVKGL